MDLSSETDAAERTQRSPTVARGKRLRRFLLKLLVAYVCLVGMLAFMQRSLIYHPTRQERIPAQDAGLPAGSVHDISLRNDAGLELHGWHVLPGGERAADRAECDHRLQSSGLLVLYFSGNAGNRQYRVFELELLTSLGADAFLFDYRGYGDNAGTPNEEHLAADAHAVWKYATTERGVDPSRIVLYGESLGGAVATRLASELCAAGTAPGGLIVRSTFSSLTDTGAYHYPWLPVRLVLADRFASSQRISDVTCPILQIHGRRDTIVPIELARNLFAAAPASSSTGASKLFLELPRADHNDVIEIATQDLRTAIGDFFGSIRHN